MEIQPLTKDAMDRLLAPPLKTDDPRELMVHAILSLCAITGSSVEEVVDLSIVFQLEVQALLRAYRGRPVDKPFNPAFGPHLQVATVLEPYLEVARPKLAGGAQACSSVKAT